MIKTVTHDGKIYPEFQTNGNAARFAMPFAKELLQGNGLDIGCNRKDWAFPGAKMIDLEINDEWDAFNLPNEKYDYIFSSHCLEHINDWVGALDYWGKHLKAGGVMFLYLPHYSQTYWRPWNNRKHVNILFLRPNQSEAVFLQFPKIAVFDGRRIADIWQPLPVSA